MHAISSESDDNAGTTHSSARALVPGVRPGGMALRMVLIMIAICSAGILLGERTFVRAGFGWDGAFYGELARQIGQGEITAQIDAYRAQRILPTVTVSLGMRLVGAPFDNASIIRGFQLFNALLLVLGTLVWVRIARALGVSDRVAWLGFVALFVNYAILKQSVFIPVNTDIAAFTLGLLVVHSFLTRRSLPLFLLTVAGAFIWPTAALSGALLLLFPRDPDPEPAREDWRYATAAAAGLALGILALLGYLYYVRGRRHLGTGPVVPTEGMGPVVPIVEAVFYLSAALLAAYIVCAVTILLRGVGPRYVLRSLKGIRLLNVLLAVGAIALPRVLVAILADPNTGPVLTTRTFLGFLAIMPVTRPLIFLVSHAIYFGPAVLLMIFAWRSIGSDVRRLGLGAIGFVMLAFLIALHSESRLSIFAYPFFIALLAPHLEGFALRPIARVTFVLLAVVLSKFWLQIHWYLPEGRRSDFNLPLHFMNHGPWMQNEAYLLHLVIALICALVLRKLSEPGSEPIVRPASPSPT